MNQYDIIDYNKFSYNIKNKKQKESLEFFMKKIKKKKALSYYTSLVHHTSQLNSQFLFD